MDNDDCVQPYNDVWMIIFNKVAGQLVRLSACQNLADWPTADKLIAYRLILRVGGALAITIGIAAAVESLFLFMGFTFTHLLYGLVHKTPA